MMEKEKSVAIIKILGIITIFVPVFFLLYQFSPFAEIEGRLKSGVWVTSCYPLTIAGLEYHPIDNLINLYNVVTMIGIIVCGAGILALRKWARVLYGWFSAIIFFVYIQLWVQTMISDIFRICPNITRFAPFIFLIASLLLLHPKLKEQFK